MKNNAQLRAKRPASALAGPYGHPFHASLVPVPIGAFVTTLVLDVASRTAGNGTGYARAATVTLGVGLAGALLAAIFGFMDYAQLEKGTKANRVATTHLVLNLLVVVALGASFLARLGSTDREVPMGLLVLTVVSLAVLGVSGWLGGKMSYRYGVRVADEQTQAEGFEPMGGLLPPQVSGAGRVDRVPGTNVPTGKSRR
ncbi:MAG TPA: DUF2231 domain-containing protein [Mycobacteriales bacterium]|jgi:uncharacterized membrane protein|nr:DUF2231 domain-containing protein [Mycobacteriales bacterium]